MEGKRYSCNIIQAEAWDDADFQDYYYEDGTRVPAGEDVGVEITHSGYKGGANFYLLDDIFYP